MSKSAANDVTGLLVRWSHGDPEAVARLLPLVYSELKRLAARYLQRERVGHTLQPTALLHEAYLRLQGEHVSWQNRTHFFAVIAQTMRRVLVDYARRRQSAKRGGGELKLTFNDARQAGANRDVEIIALDRALELLAKLNARQSLIVELRYFGGLTVEETAEVLGVSLRAVKDDWKVAKAWLYLQIAPS